MARLKEVFDEALELEIELFNRRDPLYGKTCLHLAFENNLEDELAYMILNGAGMCRVGWGHSTPVVLALLCLSVPGSFPHIQMICLAHTTTNTYMWKCKFLPLKNH